MENFKLKLFITKIHQTFIKFYSSKKKSVSPVKNHETSRDPLEDKILTEEKSEVLINFLKNNFQHDTVSNEIFRLQNLLNEVFGLVASHIQEKEIEFVFDIDKSMPIEIVGDTLFIEKVLHHLLTSILMQSHNTTLTVTFHYDTQPDKICIEIQNSDTIDQKTSDSIKGIEHSLSERGGSFSIKENGYLIELPFLRNELYTASYFTLPDSVKGQKVLFFEDNPATVKSVRKAFEGFGLTVENKSTDMLCQMTDFMPYDIIIVDSQLLTPMCLKHIEEVKYKKPLHLISLAMLHEKKDRRFKTNPLIEKYLYKPLSLHSIFGILYEIYVKNIDKYDTAASKEEVETPEVKFIEEVKNITQESFQDFNHAHVLIVDDNVINQKIIVHMLSKSNIKVSLADNGKEALDVLHEHGSDIDIILMDINMPVMDGYQATKKLRTNHRYDSLPVVIVSTLGFRNEIDEMYLAGANAHLRKPFKAGELYGALFMFLIESNPDKSNKVSAATYQENSGILDIQQGLASTKNIFAYYDLLREDLLSLSDSDHKIKKYIIQKDFLTLKAYCRQLLEESRSIGAISLEEVLSEMYILLTKNEEQYLPKYIKLYHDEWLRTKRHIELYLKSVNMF